MVGTIVRGGLVGILLLALAGCGGGSSRSPATTTTTVPKLTGLAECTFAEGGPVSKAGLAIVGPTTLVVSWDTPQTIPDSDSLALVTTVGPYRIGFERDGIELTRYLFDSTTGAQTELTGAYTELEQGISFVIPLTAVPRIKPRTRWHSTVTIDDVQVARCPATGAARFGDAQPE